MTLNVFVIFLHGAIKLRWIRRNTCRGMETVMALKNELVDI